MYVIRLADNKDGVKPVGQLCQASKVKRLLWCPKNTTNDVADTADYGMALTLANAYVNEPEDVNKFLTKLKQPAGEYHIVIWNVFRALPVATLEFEYSGPPKVPV